MVFLSFRDVVFKQLQQLVLIDIVALLTLTSKFLIILPLYNLEIDMIRDT
jgi:hypothetical protein